VGLRLRLRLGLRLALALALALTWMGRGSPPRILDGMIVDTLVGFINLAPARSQIAIWALRLTTYHLNINYNKIIKILFLSLKMKLTKSSINYSPQAVIGLAPAKLR
jgi:hypothetical protein